MIVLDENNKAIYLHDIKAPILIDHFWCLNLDIMDFTLCPLNMLVETTGPALQVRSNGFNFWLPASWYALICDDETSVLDICKINEFASKNFTAVTYGNSQCMITSANLSIVDYNPKMSIVSPALNNNQMLCHPITPYKWITITSNDVYNKYLKQTTIGDLF